MATKAATKKRQLMITLPPEISERLDRYCEKTGLNRSGYIGMLLDENLEKLDESETSDDDEE